MNRLLAGHAEKLRLATREQAPVVTVDNLREYWTVGDGAKPLDPVQRLLDAQRALREARTDAERRARLRDCEEAIAAKDAAARASLDAPEKRHPIKAYRPRTSLKREAIWFAIFVVSATLVTMAMGHGWLQIVYSVLAFEFFLRLLPFLVTWNLRSGRNDPARPEPEKPDYSALSGTEQEYFAYQLSLAAGIEDDGLWKPAIGDLVRGTAPGSRLAWIEEIDFTVIPPVYVCDYALGGSGQVNLRLGEMKPADKTDYYCVERKDL